jgi:hypothetical protein
MFARGLLFIHPASIPACSENSSKSNYSRTYESFSLNSNHSRTYVIPRGGDCLSSTSHHPQITTYRPAKFFPCVSYARTGGTLPGHTTLLDDHARLRPFGRLRASGGRYTDKEGWLESQRLHERRAGWALRWDSGQASPSPTKGKAGKTSTCRRPPVGCHRSHSRYWLPASFTCHSQTCYRTFTHPAPSLVTMLPSQGSNSYTMPTVNTRPTVHFYQCDPLREIRS